MSKCSGVMFLDMRSSIKETNYYILKRFVACLSSLFVAFKMLNLSTFLFFYPCLFLSFPIPRFVLLV